MTDPLFILSIGVLIVVGGIIGLKLHPFLALILGALVVAFMTPALAVEQYALDKGITPAAALALSKKGIGERIEVLPDRLLVYASNGEAALEAVTGRGLEPTSSLVRRCSLEDVFLRLTGRSLVD